MQFYACLDVLAAHSRSPRSPPNVDGSQNSTWIVLYAVFVAQRDPSEGYAVSVRLTVKRFLV